jgi:TRAP-type C4-dicarboxylate transport system substrate-binding protein
MRFRYVLAATIATLMTSAGCQSADTVDKSGSATAVLRLASIDEVNDNGQSYGPQAFVDNLTKVSKGQLKVQVVADYGQGDPQAESNLVKAIAAGDIDGGWPSSRAFAGAGLDGLRAIEAPLTITSYAAEKALVTSPVAAKLLGTLNPSAVEGLGLTVGPLRRPFAAKTALLGVEDWKGVRFRAFNSPVQSEAFRDLGAIPVNASFDWIDKIGEGSLRGGEFDIAQYDHNGLGIEAGNVTSNVVLWPKIFVLSINRTRLNSLTAQQQTWVRQAARQAVQASVDATYDEDTLAEKLCAKGVRFPQASPAQLAGLRTALKPTLASLAADPTTGPLLHDIQAIAGQHPQPDVPSGGSCQAKNARAEWGPIPSTPSSLPDGIYRVAYSSADVSARGWSNSGGTTGLWTFSVRDGTYELSCRPVDLPGKDCGEEVSDAPLDVGDLRGTGHTVFFIYRPDRLARITGCALPASNAKEGHCFERPPSRMSWSLKGNELTFINDPDDPDGNQGFVLKPWKKIG